MENLERKVKTIISEKLGIPLEEISPEQDLTADLGATAIEVADLLLAIEKDLNLTFPEEEKEKIKRVEQIIRLVNSQSGDFENETA